MAIKHMGPHNLDFVLSDGNGSISYENIVYASGNGIIEPGTPMKVVGGKQVPAAAAETLSGFSCYRVNTADGDVDGVILARMAELKKDLIQWPVSFTTQAEKDTAIATLSDVVAR